MQSRRVLIASANPLFAKGLQKLLLAHWGDQVELIGLTTTMEETLALLNKLEPDLVILDYDDQSLKKDEFLDHFLAGRRSMQVMLVSLHETGAVVVYDRKSLTPSQAESWLKKPLSRRKVNPKTQPDKNHLHST